jgi:hypothetical protein
MSLTDPETSARIWTLQLIEDAIAFRQNRLSLPCGDCTDGTPCPPHADDRRLAASYQEHEEKVFSEVLARVDPADAEWARKLGETPAVSASSVIVRAAWREMLADGPAIAEFDDGPPVVIVPLDGGRGFAEYVPTPAEVAALESVLGSRHPGAGADAGAGC